MNFYELPPSRQWSILKYRGERFAEVWFKPDDDPLRLTIRIFRESFHIPGMDRQLTLANLLKAVGLTPEAVAAWSHGDVTHVNREQDHAEFKDLFAALPAEVPTLDVHLRLTPPQAAAPDAAGEPQPAGACGAGGAAGEAPAEISEARWTEYETRWKALLGLEATLDTLRLSAEGLRVQMENAFKRQLSMEDKLHALRTDITLWTKAKNRIHTALPKMKDFIHRSVWVAGAPERKQMEAIYHEHIEPRIPLASRVDVLKLLESLHKARQVLHAHGAAVYQECKGITTECENALRTLQSNALANAKRKKAANSGGKFFKEIRKASGV